MGCKKIRIYREYYDLCEVARSFRTISSSSCPVFAQNLLQIDILTDSTVKRQKKLLLSLETTGSSLFNAHSL